MLDFFDILGLLGTVLVAVAYLPQIIHLIYERCSYGMSLKAWILWIVADVMMLPKAVLGRTVVFTALLSLQLFLSVVVLLFSTLYRGKSCSSHRLPPL